MSPFGKAKTVSEIDLCRDRSLSHIPNSALRLRFLAGASTWKGGTNTKSFAEKYFLTANFEAASQSCTTTTETRAEP